MVGVENYDSIVDSDKILRVKNLVTINNFFLENYSSNQHSKDGIDR